MKVHKYEITCYEGILAATHGAGEIQTRLYIPGQGVIGYRSKEQIDAFLDDPDTIRKAKEIIAKKKIKNRWGESSEYLGAIELPDDIVLKLVSTGKKLKQLKTEFQEVGKSLVNIVENISSASHNTNSGA